MRNDEIKVRMLGEFSISCGEAVCAFDNRAYKIWLFLAYLIFNHERMVARNELVSLLGNSDGYTDPGRTLRNIRMRARRALKPVSDAVGQELVISRGNLCGWNPDVPTELDVEVFQSLCAAGEASGDDAAAAEHFRSAVGMFNGDMLEIYASEPWVAVGAASCRRSYFSAVKKLLAFLEEDGAAQEAEGVCRNALRIDPYEEEILRHLMRSLMSRGDYSGAEEAYMSFRNLMLEDLGLMPGEETEELHREVVRHLGDSYVSLEDIRRQLNRQIQPGSALICDYNMFQMFYQAEARAADRRGDAIHIGVLSVEGRKGKRFSVADRERAMTQLEKQIRETLRVGDVAAACSTSQYLIMLVQANYEDSFMVARRVANAFMRNYPRSNARINVAVLPLESSPAPALSERKWG